MRHTALTRALKETTSPTWTGNRNVIRSMPAVTTRRRECLIAAMPAASSQSFITIPPCTKPAELASAIPIHFTRVAVESCCVLGVVTVG